MEKRMADALDRHITGNYGEDQFKNEKPLEFKMGDSFMWGGERHILARTINYRDENLFHFQLISAKTGNRYSNSVVTHNYGIDDLIIINEDEMIYLLEMDINVDADEIERYFASHKKGPQWKE